MICLAHGASNIVCMGQGSSGIFDWTRGGVVAVLMVVVLALMEVFLLLGVIVVGD